MRTMRRIRMSRTRTQITPTQHAHSTQHRTHSMSPHAHASAIALCRRFSRSFAPRRSTEAVKQRASRAFQLLGEAEAAIHSIPVEKVHFHEVGAVDTIVDIVCAAAGCEALGVDRWLASPLNVGSGTVVCAAWHAACSRAGHAGSAGRCAGVRGGPADGARDPDRRGDAAHARCALCTAARHAHA